MEIDIAGETDHGIIASHGSREILCEEDKNAQGQLIGSLQLSTGYTKDQTKDG